jgi:hypothetical protein
MAQNGWDILPENHVLESDIEDDSDKIYNGYCGPSADILPCGSSPLALFYYFLPKYFWLHVASESNRYWQQTLEKRVDEIFIRQQENRSKAPQSKAHIEAKLKKFKKIQPHEVVQWIGLLVAHVLCPKKRMSMHWCTSQSGVVPAGTFGDVMSRQRFQDISRFLHFSDNENPQATKDRAWKIRSILQTLQTTFKQGYILGRQVALDEGMLPSRNRYNPTRTYMKDKPHKWGSKCVMTCCANSGYCKRSVCI